MEKLEEKVIDIDKKVTSLIVIAKVVGIVAIIFGVAGSWGYTLLSGAKTELDTLKGSLIEAEQKLSSLSVFEQKKIEQFTANKLADIEKISKGKRTEIQKIAKTWPGGNYCVVKMKPSCPSGFSEGKLHLDTEDDKGDNSWSGKLPAFKYQKNNIDMYFCCK